MHVITVEFVIKPEQVARFREAMTIQAANSLTELGCRQFDVCYDPEDERRIFLYEIYDDSTAFDLHLKSAHFLDFDATVTPWVESKSVQVWNLPTASR